MELPRRNPKSARITPKSKKILLDYENQLLDKSSSVQFSQYQDWINDVPKDAGIYAFFNSSDLVYVGESGSLKGRMRDVRHTVNHTLRRTIGHQLLNHVEGFSMVWLGQIVSYVYNYPIYRHILYLVLISLTYQ